MVLNTCTYTYSLGVHIHILAYTHTAWIHIQLRAYTCTYLHIHIQLGRIPVTMYWKSMPTRTHPV